MRLRIAQFAPFEEAVPPKLYGGIERAVSYLTEELVRDGHEVVLFASGDSETRAELIACCPRAVRLNPRDANPMQAALATIWEMRARLMEFDVLHFHSSLLWEPMFREMAGRAMMTHHLRADIPSFTELVKNSPNTPMVSISRNQQEIARGLNWIATVHYGIPPSLLMPPRRAGRDYLAFLGRISPEKGPELAIEIAHRAGANIRIAAKIGEPDRGFYETTIKPLIDGRNVEFVGEIPEKAKAKFLGNARALLFPISWPEPFGLVMIEAMACGTPVIAFRQGSVPEVIEHGVTGFLVDTVDEAVASVSRLHELNSAQIRAVFERKFSVSRMAREYLEIYNSLRKQPPWRL